MMIILLLVSLGAYIMDSPTTRELEAVICYRYFEATDPSKIKIPRSLIGPGAIGGVDEFICKADAVQNELAEVNAYRVALDAFPSLLLSIPFAWLADKYGRWWLLFLNLLAAVLKTGWIQLVLWFWQAFDVRWTYLGSVFNLAGGMELKAG